MKKGAKNKKDKLVFIHSLFRSGSTYIFNIFRSSKVDYWTYQEPLSEWPALIDSDPDKVFGMSSDASKFLRHPRLDKPYFYEFESLAAKIPKLFHKEFGYDQYFSSTKKELTDLKKYLELLIDNAPCLPVIQECRSSGRVGELKELLGGTHIFLWRNPWDQWWSYKLGFDTNNLLIANAPSIPPFMKKIRKELKLPEFHESNIFNEVEFFKERWLDSYGSYMLFFSLWCHAMLEAYPKCDLAINIDSLSKSTEYRADISSQLEQMEIEGLDFSGCNIPQAIYGKSDQDFFSEIEEKVFAILLDSGYSAESIEEIKKLRQSHQPAFAKAKQKDTVVRDALRARELAIRFETEASVMTGAARDEHALAEQMQTEWDSASDHVDKLMLQLGDQSETLENVQGAVDDYKDALTASKKACDKEHEYSKQLETEWDSSKDHVGKLKVQLNEQSEILENVQDAVDDYKEARDKEHEHNEQLQIEWDSAKEHVEKLIIQLDEAGVVLTDHQAALAASQEDCVKEQAHSKRMQDDFAAARVNHEQEMQNVLNSLSWRVTRWLRWLVALRRG